MKSTHARKHKYDIICIGLGCCGLYLGYTLFNTNKKILFIEQNTNIGGRIQSLELIPNQGYYANGCATRYFPNEHKLVKDLLDELKIKSYPIPNDKIFTQEEYKVLFKKLLKVFPDPNPEMSFRQAMSETLGPDAVQTFSDTSGYQIFSYNFNMAMAYKGILSVSSNTQYYPEGGFYNICLSMFNKIKNKEGYQFLFYNYVLAL